MKLPSGTRIGQSGTELTAAVVFSLFFHVIFLFAAVFLSFRASPRISVPPFYRVTLVDLPPGTPLVSPGTPEAPAVPAQPAPPKPPAAKQTARTPSLPKAAAAPRDAMPELGKEQKQATPAPDVGAGKPQEKVSVAVAGGGQQFPFLPYVAIVRDKVERNWNPPPGAKGAKATVQFTILRSGRVGDARLREPSGNFYFDQSALRAILASSPFPPLPEGFFKDFETFSVDLMEKD